MKINHLLGAVGSAVQDAYRAVELYSVENFLKGYFDENMNEDHTSSYTPKMIRLEMPSGNGEKKVVCTPVAALAHHRQMNLDSIRLSLNVGIVDDENEELMVSMKSAASNESECPEKNIGTLEINIKCTDAAEGISRIETQLNNMV